MISVFGHTLHNNYVLLVKLYKYNKRLFAIRIFYAFMNSFLSIAGILFPKYMLTAVINGEAEQILMTGAGFGFAFLFFRMIGIFYGRYDKIATEKMYATILNEFLCKTLELDLSFFDRTESYSKYNRAFGNSCEVIHSCGEILITTLTSVLQLIMISAILIWVDFWIFLAVVISILISFFINNYIKKIDYKFMKKMSEKNKQINYLYRLFYIPQFVRELKTNNLNDFIFSKKRGFNDGIIRDLEEQSRIKVKFSLLTESKDVLENIAVGIYFGFSVLAQKIAVPDYFTSVNAYNQLKNAILSILSSYTSLYSNSLFADDYLEFMSSDEVSTTNTNGNPISSAEIDKIEFINVSFRYPNAEVFALKGISFSVNKGDKIAFVGRNGAGKTTIIKLLLRLYDPFDGEIRINGVNIKEYRTFDLRNAIQVLFQDYVVYAFTIKENITLGKNINDATVLDSIEKVGLKDKILRLNNGVDTPITSQLYESGVELSGGETQRIAISRIYAGKPHIFVMDEPTSNIDPYAEYQMYDDIVTGGNNDTTSIIISHRLTLTYKMDKVYVIENGKIAEEGNHYELLKLGGIYSEMYQIQAEKYVSNNS